MPAPLGKTPTRKMPKIDVYGLVDSQPTRAAIRFFRERRIVVQFIDLRKKPLAAAELRRFADVVGMDALLDSGTAGPAADGPAEAPPIGSLGQAHDDPRLLRLPLVRYGDRMTTGKNEETWARWLEAARRSGR